MAVDLTAASWIQQRPPSDHPRNREMLWVTASRSVTSLPPYLDLDVCCQACQASIALTAVARVHPELTAEHLAPLQGLLQAPPLPVRSEACRWMCIWVACQEMDRC